VSAVSLSELRTKDVVNVCDGKRVGKVMEIEFNTETGHLESIVVPGAFDFLALLRGQRKGIVIPWNQICCFGDDIILVQFNDGTE
jgi:YlmC/YmxH family sporulation protein